jgi:isoquinoline 1-oxidoreductase beta subunit
VVAEDPFRLAAIVAAVDARWRRPPVFGQAEIDAEIDVDGRLARGALESVLVDDGLGTDGGGGPWDVDLRVDTPLAAHAPIEARAGVARWTGDRCEVWVGTQDVFLARDLFARTLGVDPGHVVLHGQRVGGGFGGRAGFEGLEAAVLARAARRPVKVQWSRPDDFQRSYHGPPTSHRIRARLGADGKIAAWWHALTSGHVLLNPLALPAWLQAATGLITDGGAVRGAVPPYALGRRRIEASDVRLPIATGAWRGLGATPNTFAIEAAIDALAARAGADPLAFRLRHLDAQSRLARCLEVVRDRSAWRGPGGPGRGVAVAAAIYKDTTPVAVVAQVEIRGGLAHVERVVCAHDCGRVINPGRVRAQIEGNIYWALGYALRHRLTVAGGRVDAAYLTSYPLPTIVDAPVLELALVGADHGAPLSGAGEPAVTAATAAIAAAAAQAFGVAPRALPVVGRPR